jgi:hypothetical protein
VSPTRAPAVHSGALAPLNIGTPTPSCHYQQYGAVAGRPVSFANTVLSDQVARYVCPDCQPGGNATSSDLASKGPIQNAESKPVVEVVFWGKAWSNPTTTPSTGQIWQSLKTMFASPYFDGLKQYGVNSVTLDKSYIANDDPANSYGSSNDELAAAQARTFKVIDSTTVFSHRDSNTVFMVIMPPTTSPPPGACGAHEIQTEFHRFQVNTANVGFAAFSDLDSMTATITHELVEAITDPHGTISGVNAWTMNRGFGDPPGRELGDACNGDEDFLNGVLVQSYWSNTDRACIIPFPATPTITSLSAAVGSDAGGQTITINGTNFDTHGATTLTFNGWPIQTLACSSSTQCSFIAPSEPAETVNIGVIVNNYFHSNTLPYRFGPVPPSCSAAWSCSPEGTFAVTTITCQSAGALTLQRLQADGTFQPVNVTAWPNASVPASSYFIDRSNPGAGVTVTYQVTVQDPSLGSAVSRPLTLTTTACSCPRAPATCGGELQCGVAPDTCGGTINCGACASGLSCGDNHCCPSGENWNGSSCAVPVDPRSCPNGGGWCPVLNCCSYVCKKGATRSCM